MAKNPENSNRDLHRHCTQEALVRTRFFETYMNKIVKISPELCLLIPRKMKIELKGHRYIMHALSPWMQGEGIGYNNCGGRKKSPTNPQQSRSNLRNLAPVSPSMEDTLHMFPRYIISSYVFFQ